MYWQFPNALYLLWIIPVWIGLCMYARSRRQRAARSFVAEAMESRILPRAGRTRFWVRTGISALALVFAILALARPRFGVYFEEVRKRGSDLYVLLDVSKSMLATDVAPSRLERAKADVKVLLKRLEGERVGLIAFAGKPVVKCPLTTDLGFFRLALSDVDVNSAPRGGTAIGDAIRKAIEVLPQESHRDQALLVITDGEDHESYPFDAAKAAAERHITIFTVGLGDPEQGARVPGKTRGTFLRHDGKQIWSKLDENGLREIALLTNGGYFPARTGSYDLGTLYADRLSKLKGEVATEKKRKRLHERYQIFLSLSLACFLFNLLIRPYALSDRRKPFSSAAEVGDKSAGKQAKKAAPKASPKVTAAGLMIVTSGLWLSGAAGGRAWSAEGESPEALNAGSVKEDLESEGEDSKKKEAPARKAEEEKIAAPVVADEDQGRDAGSLIEEGLALYRDEKFDAARKKFVAADVAQPETPLIAFNLGCVYQRKGDAERAEEQYHRAGLARDRKISTAARYNMGLAEAEVAKKKLGAQPESIAPEKRQEALDALMSAVGHFRQCIEVEPDHKRARRNLELIRQWIKYYTEKWRAQDREQRRQQMDLMQLLEYMLQAQEALRSSTRELAKDPDAKYSAYFDLRNAQEQLAEEIPTLKLKIDELKKQAPPQQAPPPPPPPTPGQKAPPSIQPSPQEELEKDIKQLNEWAEAVAKAMDETVVKLDEREGKDAVAEQEKAHEKLDHLWMAVAPFSPVLTKAFQNQTLITTQLEPMQEKKDEPDEAGKPKKEEDTSAKTEPARDDEETKALNEELASLQARTGRHTHLLPQKAEQILEQLKNAPASPAPGPGPTPPQPGVQQGDEQGKIKKALEKALELAPKALEHQRKAHEQILAGKRTLAHPEAEAARKMLEEISKEMPQDEKKQDQQQQDQQKQDQQKQDQQQQKQEKKEDQRQDQKKEKQQPERKKDMNKNQAEALLRRVREREQERRKKMEEIREQMVAPGEVDRDW